MLPVFGLAHHHHVVAAAVDGQVFGLAQGIEQRHLVAADGVESGAGHFAHDRVVQVLKLDRHNGVFDQVLVGEALLDERSHLFAGQTRHLYAAQHRKVHAAVSAYIEAGDLLAVARLRHRTYTIGGDGQVEEL